MKEDPTETAEALPPHVQLIEMAVGYRISQIVYAAAKLGLADQLAERGKTAVELAEPTGTQEAVLYRLMRSLASLGILSENADQRFELTRLGSALRSDAPGSARAAVLYFVDKLSWLSWAELPYCLETGSTGVEKAFGKKLWDYLADNPGLWSYGNEAVKSFHDEEPPAVTDAYDFSTFHTAIDIGGGTGNLLSAILTRYPSVRGTLFDQAEVVSRAKDLIESRGLSNRVEFEAGDFFHSVPSGGDVYVLSHIIHDFHDDQCVTILANCRRAISPDGRLLIVEMVLPPGNTPHAGKLLDIEMLVMPGGQERTEREYGVLLSRAGFHLERVVPTESAVSVVEAIPA
jgi:hypothetical protein